MVRSRQRRLATVAVFAIAIAVAVPVAASSTTTGSRLASTPLLTGVDYAPAPGTDIATAARHIKAVGGGMVRLPLAWSTIAPGGATKPAGFDAQDPDDPLYHWSDLDAEVQAATDAGLQVMLSVTGGAPSWAAPHPRYRPQDGPWTPSVSDFGDFAAAAAQHYSGTDGAPRVKYWESWNEPNVSLYLMPQIYRGKVVSPGWYRRLLNAFTDAVHGVDPTNVSIAGALSPFTVRKPSVETIGPLAFLRTLFCVSAGTHPHATCNDRVKFDALSVHPYTSGNAQHHALNPNDLSLGDLPELKALLNAALRMKHVVHTRPIEEWVTEFSWDSKPPDPDGVPTQLEARWVAEALHQAWANGVTHFLWFTLRDLPLRTSDFQSGLYFAGSSFSRDRPKPAARAFRFPFVAYQQKSARAQVWGRTPTSRAGTVRIQRVSNGRWTTIATERASRYGVFGGTVRSPSGVGSLRAVAGSAVSQPFSLVVPKDLPVDPFGSTSTG